MSPLGSMPSPGQQPCPSPHSPSLAGQPGFPGYPAGGQVSPRAAPAPAAAPAQFAAQLSPGGGGGAQARAAAVAAAAGKLQQQNPELNAQLSVSRPGDGKGKMCGCFPYIVYCMYSPRPVVPSQDSPTLFHNNAIW